MAIIGLYFIPSTSSSSTSYGAIQERLSQLAATTSSNALPPWTLTHHLFADTSSLLPHAGGAQSGIPPRRYLQWLTLPQHRAGSMFVGASSTPGKGFSASQQPNGTPGANGGTGNGGEDGMSVISIPTTNAEDFFYTVQNKMQPLWMARMVVRVENGFGYEIGDWKIRVGEVKQTSGPAGQARVRGCVVEATMPSEESNDDLNDDGKGQTDTEVLFKEVWERLHLEEGSAFVDVAGVEARDDGLNLTKQYFELLRFTRTG